MDLKHLQTFLCLCEINNFTKTAEHLHYAQSHVTMQIQQLEEELNVKLFERLGKKISLTTDGQKLIPYAQKMLSLSKDIEFQFAKQDNGRIVIGASESLCLYRLPNIIKLFSNQYPSVEVCLYVLESNDYLSLLANNTIDIAFVLDRPLAHLHFEKVLQIPETIGIFSLPQHPLAQKKNVSLKDLANQRLIVTKKECCYRQQFDYDLNKIKITPHIVLETSSIQVIKQSVLSGLGICVLPEFVVQDEMKQNQLKAIEYLTHYSIQSQLIYHRDKWLSPSLKHFIDMAKKLIE